MGETQRRLYVGNLPPDISEEELRAVFELYGIVDDIFVNKLTGVQTVDQRRSAFVGFQQEHDATAAMLVLSEMYKFRETMTPIFVKAARPHCGDDNEHRHLPSSEVLLLLPPAPPPAPPALPVLGPPLGPIMGNGYGKVGPASGAGCSGGPPAATSRPPESKLWVGSLPGDITQDVLVRVFSTYGKLIEINLMPVKARSGQACAFVHFSTKEEADACLIDMGMGYEIRPGCGPIMVERPGNKRKGVSKGVSYVKGGPGLPPAISGGPGVGPMMPLMLSPPPGPPLGPPLGPALGPPMGPPGGYRYQPYFP